jgi:hypothetical protein
MNIVTPPRAPSRKQAIIATGRAHLKTWLLAAEAHGTIYYNIQSVSRSGMNRKISLSTIFMGSDGMADCRCGNYEKASLVRLWPSYGENASKFDTTYNEGLDIIARDWGFSFDARAFNISGCGMDMCFALVDSLAGLAGLNNHDGSAKGCYANRVRRESF